MEDSDVYPPFISPNVAKVIRFYGSMLNELSVRRFPDALNRAYADSCDNSSLMQNTLSDFFNLWCI